MHVYLFDAADGTPFDGLKNVQLEATLPSEDIGPIELELAARRAGPLHAPDAALGVPGEWTLEVSGRLSRFEELRGTAEVRDR